MSNDSTKKVFVVAFSLCLVCSLLVSAAAVGLKSIQEENKSLARKENILKAAGIYNKDVPVAELYKQIESKVVDLSTGKYVDINADTFDQRKAAKDPASSIIIPSGGDQAGIGHRSKYANVYLLKDGKTLKRVILPIHGKGLWSTMYGFIALAPDLTTVKSFGFYEHGETPGLGGEVDNPNWKAKWIDKKVYNDKGEPVLDVIKGTVNPADPMAAHEVDGLAGATLTSRGVTNLVHYWLGEGGFELYLKQLAIEEGDQNG
ncbi:Na(+)-translocating NADH-quinone reductase subunit C [Desulfovibrio gilichinskyi]|uniref:Na(+)-translocating NADH-quinone reductase subunit C n=1 Tax=Desulfovibrio gilichinskyi TaxID=1519643 RepID=A0A1X7DR65_9BACT|nr:Na(+)-translocating NADH-quinone reductase subunit C [Desulfovibrio gilichinskyi]SMF20021.1 Na+-transporting NADH:ubiquinone oxidoreductase subunit C [Desulfovibrio gilichinskyi]